MIIATKKLSPQQAQLVELLMCDAFSPINSFLKRQDVLSVIDNFRLSNGKLWALPFALPLTVEEKRTAQITGKLGLVDHEDRLIAEVSIDDIYRLPAETVHHFHFFDESLSGAQWFAAGSIQAHKPVLHGQFHRSRRTPAQLKQAFNEHKWKQVIAVQAQPHLHTKDTEQACEWLFSRKYGGVVVQAIVNDQDELFRDAVYSIRHQIRCSAARQTQLSLLPEIKHISEQRSTLLYALIARNSGATALVLNHQTSKLTRTWIMRYRDELSLDILPKQHQNKVPQQTTRQFNMKAA